MWVAKDVPGAAEYIAFQKASAASDMAAAAWAPPASTSRAWTS